MKHSNLIFVAIFLSSAFGLAQESTHNFGNLKIHDNGAIGFHYDFINNGISDDNQGLAGFFCLQSQRISGAFEPTFRDMEVLVGKDLYLEIGVNITNNTNFIFGDVITPRNLLDVNLEYFNSSFYNGDDDRTKVDGYSAITSKQNFVFPIGDDNRLRRLEILGESTIPHAKSAYFFENPNTSSTFPTSFDTEDYDDRLTAISTIEFWDINAGVTSRVRIGWDVESQIENLVDDIENLRVVGWNTNNDKWEDLGNIAVDGDLSSGNITSDIFLPDDYSIITFGGGFNRADIQLGNYILSPNGDGNNDFLYFNEIAISPNNNLEIFNRWGRMVFKEENYTNLFQGKANVSGVVQIGKPLPTGVYFYIIKLHDLDIIHQGYLFIAE
jgi:gliding motility-associated-like protein